LIQCSLSHFSDGYNRFRFSVDKNLATRGKIALDASGLTPRRDCQVGRRSRRSGSNPPAWARSRERPRTGTDAGARSHGGERAGSRAKRARGRHSRQVDDDGDDNGGDDGSDRGAASDDDDDDDIGCIDCDDDEPDDDDTAS